METKIIAILLVIIDNQGEEFKPNYYCESKLLKMYCSRTTAQFCYPVSDTRLGSKRCIEGWKEIPVIIENVINEFSSERIHCTSEGCV